MEKEYQSSVLTFLGNDESQIRERLKQLESTVLHFLDNCSYTVRVREGGGPENIAASLAVTLQILKDKIK